MPVIVKTANQEVLDRAAALLTGIDGGMAQSAPMKTLPSGTPIRTACRLLSGSLGTKSLCTVMTAQDP